MELTKDDDMKKGKWKGLKNQSIRRQLMFYMGFFVVLPLCLALMLLNIYLQRVTTENKISNETTLMSQIKDNADQMTEVTNYATSMLMTNRSVMDYLRILEEDGDSYEFYQAKRKLSARISEIESSVLNAVDGKLAVLTKSGYLIGSYNLSKTSLDYEDKVWYEKVTENGRKTTYCTEIASLFSEMTPYALRSQHYLYMGRGILDYSGENLGIILIQLSESKIWGKFTKTMIPDKEGALYIFSSDGELLMEFNGIYQEAVRSLRNVEEVWEESEQVSTGTMENGFYYMSVSLENASNHLVYLVPENVFLQENKRIARRILEMILLVIAFTICTMIYLSKKLSRPLVHVAETLERASSGIVRLEEPDNSFLEIQKFIASYNRAGQRIEELFQRVKTETYLKEKARYEMLMSQISPHFIFNTVNSIGIMAKEEGNGKTERALEALGDILHAVYGNKNGMTTVGQETALLAAYVDIMQMRFGDSFRYYNVIPTELYFYQIPAFTMQPIVENAILHGVKDIQAGQIIVSAVEYEKDFVISVFNNGNSADKEVIDKLLRGDYKNQKTFTGIGLYNVDSRLKMLYGESYGLIFNEQVKAGFEIWIRIPKCQSDMDGGIKHEESIDCGG